MGNKSFESWMVEGETPDELIDRIRKNFTLGGHKAAAIAGVLKKARVFLVSELEPDFVRSIFLEPYSTVQEAYEDALKELGDVEKVLIMPYGGSTLPVIKDE